MRTYLEYYRIIGVVSASEGDVVGADKAARDRKAVASGRLSSRHQLHQQRRTSCSSEASTKLNLSLDLDVSLFSSV